MEIRARAPERMSTGSPEKEKSGYKKLIVWQKADFLAHLVYTHTKTFPKEEVYGLTSQIRRSAVSVPTNLVEGYSRQNRKELKQYVNIALGSLAELEYLLDFSLRIGYLNQDSHQELLAARKEVGGRLWNFYKKI